MHNHIRRGARGTAALLLAGIATPVLAQANADISINDPAAQAEDESAIVVTGNVQ